MLAFKKTRQLSAVAGESVYSNVTDSTTMLKMPFATSTVSTTTSAPDTCSDGAGWSNAGVAGYMARGYATNTIYKWDYTTDAVSTTSNAPGTIGESTAMSNTGVAGYVPAGQRTTPLYKIAYSNDSWSTLTAFATQVRRNAGWSNTGVAGYINMGSTGTRTVYKIGFPTDTRTTLLATNSYSYNIGFSNPGVGGFIMQGANTGETISYPTDTFSLMNITWSNVNSRTASTELGVGGIIWLTAWLGSANNNVAQMPFATQTMSIRASSPVNIGYRPPSFSEQL